MNTTRPQSGVLTAPPKAGAAAFGMVIAVSSVHLLNDVMQSVILALYPLLKDEFALDFFQIGLITLTFQITASLLQPVVGLVTDRYPFPAIMPIGMMFSCAGIILLALAPNYPLLLLAVALIGIGSSTFHPEAARIARLASGGRFGLAQSIFQIGGNLGQAVGPTLAAVLVLSRGAGGRPYAAGAAVLAFIAATILIRVAGWYRAHLNQSRSSTKSVVKARYSPQVIRRAVGILFLLMFSKFFYMVSISSFFTFYLIESFGVSEDNAAHLLALFLFAVAVGTLIGGPLGDRLGRRRVIWFSILGVTPFTLTLPFVGLTMTVILSVIIGVILASAFPAIIVYAQDMLIHRLGMVSGLFYGFSFGMGGLGAGALGFLADHYGIVFVYRVSALLPLLGLFAVFLPDIRPPEKEASENAAAAS